MLHKQVQVQVHGRQAQVLDGCVLVLGGNVHDVHAYGDGLVLWEAGVGEICNGLVWFV